LTDGFDWGGEVSSENHPMDDEQGAGGVSINDIYERVQSKRKRKRNEFFQRNGGCLDSFPQQRGPYHPNDVRSNPTQSLHEMSHPAGLYKNGHTRPSKPPKPRNSVSNNPRPNMSSRPFQGWSAPPGTGTWSTPPGTSQMISLSDDQPSMNHCQPNNQPVSNGRQPLISLPDDQPIGLIMNTNTDPVAFPTTVDVESTEKTITFCDLSD